MSLLRRLGPLVMLGLALAPPASATTKDCRRSTPLPDDVRLTAPASDVPANVARFAGAWSGVWLIRRATRCCARRSSSRRSSQRLRPDRPQPLLVPRVNLSHPTSWRATGRVADGVLRFKLPTPDRVELTYRFDGDTLASTVSDRQGSHGTLTRLDELSQVECGRAERRPR